ncbi:MAG: hypothetical protein ABW252_21645 [Polyangiales bacterium]
MKRKRWLSVCIFGMVACGDAELLGENGDESRLDGEVPVHKEPTLGVQFPNPITLPETFEIEPERIVPATWTVPMQPQPGSEMTDGLSLVQVEAAPDGNVWVARLLDPARTLLRLDGSGREVAAYATMDPTVADNLLGSLTVSPSLSPVFEAKTVPRLGKGANTCSAWIPGEGGRLQALTAPRGPKVERAVAGTDETLRYVTGGDDRWLRIHDARNDGEVMWSRAMEPPSGFSRMIEPLPANSVLTPPVTVLSDGSTLFLRATPKAGQEDSSLVTGMLTRVDARGTVRWHMTFERNLDATAIPSMLLAPMPDGGFAMTIANGGDSWVYNFDRNARLLGSWQIAPANYYGEAPDALVSDVAGNLYFALVTGARRSPRLTVCKLAANDAGATPQCVGLDGGTGASVRISDLASPQPDAVVVAYATARDASAASESWQLSRVDF